MKTEEEQLFSDELDLIKNTRPDFAIIELETPFKFNENIRPACLPAKPVEPGTTCYISGWGRDIPYDPRFPDDHKQPDLLQGAKFKITQL